MSVWGVLQSKLSNDATLTGQLGSGSAGVLYGRLPAHTAFPFVHIQSLDGSDNAYQAPCKPGSGIGYMETIQGQIDVYNENDPSVTLAIAKRIDALLNFQQPAGDDSGILTIRRTSSLDDVWVEDEPNENANDVWRITLLYEIQLWKTL